MKIQNKKGIQLNQAMGAVLALILVAVLVIVSVYMFASLSTATLVPNFAATAVNESLARPTTTGVTLGAGNRISGSCGTITSLINGTNGVVINSGNYSQNGCVVTNTTSVAHFGSTWLANYPYTYSAATSASNASDATIVQFASYPALVGLVGTIVFLGIVIGVLVASFVFGGKGGP